MTNSLRVKNSVSQRPRRTSLALKSNPIPDPLKKKHSRGAVVVFTILFLDVLRRVRCGIRGSAWDVHSKCLVSDNRRLFWPKSSSELFVSCILSHRFGILINTDLTWKYHAHNISTQSTMIFSKYIVLVHTLSVYVRMCEWVFNIMREPTNRLWRYSVDIDLAIEQLLQWLEAGNPWVMSESWA